MTNTKMGLIVTSTLALLLSGCFRSDPPIRFYLLDAHSESANPNDRPWRSSASKTVVGVGPVHIPEYLNRPQIVVGVGENQYRLDERHRWAERLDQNISRTLLLSLSGELDEVQLLRFPWTQRQEVDYQIRIEVLELHREAAGRSRLSAQWNVVHGNHTLAARWFDCSLPVASDDFDDFVKAQSECLARLSSEIAGTLGPLVTNPGERNAKAVR